MDDWDPGTLAGILQLFQDSIERDGYRPGSAWLIGSAVFLFWLARRLVVWALGRADKVLDGREHRHIELVAELQRMEAKLNAQDDALDRMRREADDYRQKWLEESERVARLIQASYPGRRSDDDPPAT